MSVIFAGAETPLPCSRIKSEARTTLGRLLLAENRDADALREYGELLDVLDRALSFPPTDEAFA